MNRSASLSLSVDAFVREVDEITDNNVSPAREEPRRSSTASVHNSVDLAAIVSRAKHQKILSNQENDQVELASVDTTKYSKNTKVTQT